MKRKSISSSQKIDHRIIIGLAALLGLGNFLLSSAFTYRIGFPLDDAWIHQTYARNFAMFGEWAFRIGVPSAGSTSPLWTALISVGYLFGLSPYPWTFALGWIILAAIGIRAEGIARRLVDSYQTGIPWVGLFMVLAWHLTWSATSGMETLLHGLIILIVLGMLAEGSRHYLTLGLFAGLSVWVRPDGLTLLGPILVAGLIQESTFRLRGRMVVKAFIGFGVIYVFYLLFNLALSGSPMPNTFYAKQAEYGNYWLSNSFSERLFQYIIPIIAGPFVSILPGFINWIYLIIRDRNWGATTGLIWAVGYIGIYVLYLPAYQHGRYIIPAFPYIYLLGLLGLVSLTTRVNFDARIKFGWTTTIIILTLVFQWIGARQNAQDVILVESQMVETAHWIKENLPQNAVIGIHDIGAIGYYTENPIIDLAGLITPDVIPFIRDEQRLSEHLDESQADYLVTFPEWYPGLVFGRPVLYIANDEVFPFNDRMTVYGWHR